MWKHLLKKPNKLRCSKVRAKSKPRISANKENHWKNKKHSLSIKKKRMNLKSKNWIIRSHKWRLITPKKFRMLNKKRKCSRNRANNHLLNRFLYMKRIRWSSKAKFHRLKRCKNQRNLSSKRGSQTLRQPRVKVLSRPNSINNLRKRRCKRNSTRRLRSWKRKKNKIFLK